MAVQDEKPVSSKEDLFQLCFGHPGRLALIEPAFCPASELKSRLYRPPLYSGLHGLCDGALYPVGGFDL